MRKITQNAVNALLAAGTFSQGNTTVTLNDGRALGEWSNSDSMVSRMYLHGNLIATLDHNTKLLTITNAGWSSNTTKERLNGLPNVSIHQANWQWYLNGKEWDGSSITIDPVSMQAA